ncbi:hypothetical protein [Natrinema salaciae]|uniref:Uncharacterized protein n=1 Tax=Natrinema salaciae TaxID=1186196 RepID=A0A1H9IRX6_9EURY|nr:hypothetical protein [Natrinema salaciae]SEQ77316.1 hypothetical protein SAMN04489841_2314 [Natrinema salaciae]
MSPETDDRRSLGARAAVGAALEHPLVGLHRRRTALTVTYLLGLTATFLLSYVGARLPVDDAVLQTLTTGLDTLSLVFIAVVTPTILVVPLVSAAWNGGPGLSALVPVVPVALGDIIAGAYVLDLDVAIALTVCPSAAALALVSADVRRTGSLRFWRSGVDEDRLLFVTAIAIVTAVGVGRFVSTAPSYMLEWYAPMGGYWLVTATVVGSYWLAAVRSTWRTDDSHAAADS